MNEYDFAFIIAIVVAILITLAMRELVCWYFKINKLIKLQQSLIETMLKMYEQNGGEVNWEAANKTIGK